MITWDEFKDQGTDFRNLVDPKCGKMVYRNDFMVYASLPPKHQYFCEECGWNDFA